MEHTAPGTLRTLSIPPPMYTQPASVPLQRPPRLLALALLLALSFFPVHLHAQAIVSGRLTNSSGGAIASSAVRLLAASDSAVVHATVTDVHGAFAFRSVETGSYLLHASHIGFREHFSAVFAVVPGERLDLGAVTLVEEAIRLDEVTVETQKPLYQLQGDRLVINVASSPGLAGATAIQVLERAPGIVVDRMTNSVSLVGKDGVQVLVNGRPSYIPADGLVAYLASLSADVLERIELITTPPANLDAEGNAGYINVVLKRNPDDGFNGTASVTAGYSSGESANASTTLNFRRGGLALFGNYSFAWDGEDQHFRYFRRIVDANGVTETPSHTDRQPITRYHVGRLGAEYQVSPRTTVGGLVSGFERRWTMDAETWLSVTTDGVPISTVSGGNEELNLWRHAMGNLNLTQKVGASGSLRFDLDHLRYHNDNPTTYRNTSTDLPTGESLLDQVETGKLTPLRILVAQADYSREVGGRELAAGVKGAFTRFTNETSLTGLRDDEWIEEAGFGSSATLREDVLAAYARAKLTRGEATTVNLGLRYELTDSNLSSDREDNLVDRRFGKFFPSVSASHKLRGGQQFDASYARRITRPSFGNMAPFLYFWDPLNFTTGNQALQPAIVNTVRIGAMRRSTVLSLQYSWEDSTIAHNEVHLIPGRNIQVSFPVNFRGTRAWSANVAVPVRVTSWWSMQNNGMANWRTIDGYRNRDPVTLRSRSFGINSTQTFTLSRELSVELFGFANSSAVYGTMKWSPLWLVNGAVQKKLGSSGRFSLAADNLFDSYAPLGRMGSPDDELYVERGARWKGPWIRASYSRTFGQGRAVRRRPAASEEESGRV